jgi:hypothetical protein
MARSSGSDVGRQVSAAVRLDLAHDSAVDSDAGTATTGSELSGEQGAFDIGDAPIEADAVEG